MPTVLMLLSKPFAGDPRVNRETNSLAGDDFSTAVLAWNRDGSDRDESPDGLKVEVELIGPKCPRRSFFKFLVRLPFFWLACLRRSRRKQFLVVHAHDFDTLPIGFLISRLRGRPLVYDAHESYADMIAGDVPAFIGMKVHWAERMLQTRADAVFVANENVAKLIGADGAIELLNCPSKSEIPIECSEDSRKLKEGRNLMGYFGTLEPGRFIMESISAISTQSKWRIVIGGDGTLARSIRKAAKNSGSVEFLGNIPHEDVMRRSAQCDVLHVMLDPSNVNYRISTPLRLFEAMSLGIPSIVSEGTYPAGVVSKEGCGYACEYGEKPFSDLLARLADTPADMNEKGSRGRIAFEREFNWERQAEKLLLAYRQLLGTADN